MFNEWELLTLREGLFLFKKHYPLKIDETEFKQIDNKFKKILEGL